MGLVDVAATVVLKPLCLARDVVEVFASMLILVPVCLYKAPTTLYDFVNVAQSTPLGMRSFKLVNLVSSAYSSSVGASVSKIEFPSEKSIKITAKFRVMPWHTNPFKSAHAAALINFGELTTGYAVIGAMSREEEPMRYIVTKLEGDYKRKSRGSLTCVCEFTVPSKEGAVPVVGIITDESGVETARITAHWIFSERRNKKTD